MKPPFPMKLLFHSLVLSVALIGGLAASRAADDEPALAFVRANQPALVAKLKARMSASELAEAKALAAARRAPLP